MTLVMVFAQGAVDTTAPTLDITVNPDRSRISGISGRDTTTFTFQVNEAYQAYKIKIVPSGASPHTAGTQIESGGSGLANTDRVVNVTDDELIAGGVGEGTHTIKVFAQDSAGNWST